MGKSVLTQSISYNHTLCTNSQQRTKEGYQRSRCLNTWSPAHGVVWRSHRTFRRYSHVGGSIALGVGFGGLQPQTIPLCPPPRLFMSVPTDVISQLLMPANLLPCLPHHHGLSLWHCKPKVIFLRVFGPVVFIPGTEKQLKQVST